MKTMGDRSEQGTLPLVGKNILIVDDSLDGAGALAEMLGGDGHNVRIAGDGPSALELMSEFTPDLVLLDIGLPGMDGYALALEIRKRVAFDATRLIAVTGYGQSSDRERAANAGFAGYLLKPIDLGRLYELIANQ